MNFVSRIVGWSLSLSRGCDRDYPIRIKLSLRDQTLFFTFGRKVLSTTGTVAVAQFTHGSEQTSNKNKSSSSTPPINNQINQNKLYGITDDLIIHIQSFTFETFKNFIFKIYTELFYVDEEKEEGMINNGGGESNVQKDLSDWQEKHALLVLSTVKELSQRRFRLCPRYLKGQFWRIYFTLVKNYVAKYELHAIRLETLKQIEIENRKDSNTGAYEVEMLEARKPENLEPEDSLV